MVNVPDWSSTENTPCICPACPCSNFDLSRVRAASKAANSIAELHLEGKSGASTDTRPITDEMATEIGAAASEDPAMPGRGGGGGGGASEGQVELTKPAIGNQ
jgi:hypothetical protein